MHIVESGKRYRIFNNAITTYDQLPPKTYRVDYDPETRIFSLLEAHDFEIPETKIYGQHLDKVKKVLNSMDKMNRNLGVILSGDKGIGKSLFSKCLGLKARKKGIPVILVNEYPNFSTPRNCTYCGYLLYWLMNIMRGLQTFLKKLSKQL